jgi:RsiW-degrading membrane proteinase PrsW (M82 family)
LAFLALAVLPYVLLHSVSPTDSVGPAAWTFTLYFAGIWFVAIRALVKPERVSNWRLTGIIAFTAMVGVSIAVTLERSLASTSGSFVHNTLGIGLPEEFAKALPIFLFVYLTRRRHFSPRTYLYLGAVSGIAFGAIEAATYSIAYASVLPSTGATYLSTQIWRLITDPVSHAAMAGISCYFMGLAAADRTKRVPLIGLGLGAAALLHGAYDTTAATWMGVAVAALTVFVFLGYALSGERIAAHYRTVDERSTAPSSSLGGRGDPTRSAVPSPPPAGQMYYAVSSPAASDAQRVPNRHDHQQGAATLWR